jgi:hypothetical protein
LITITKTEPWLVPTHNEAETAVSGIEDYLLSDTIETKKKDNENERPNLRAKVSAKVSVVTASFG